MFCEINDNVDIENRRGLRAPDTTQVILSLYTFLGTLLIKLFHLNCGGWKWGLWIDFVFFGSLVWLTYLLISLVGKYKNANLQSYFNLLDYFFFAFHLAMWIWLVVIFAKNEYLGCSSPVDMFGIVYLVFGALAVLILIISAIGGLFSLIRPNDSANQRIGGLYDNDVDFNPYQ
jgi:hypothetical protein